MKRRDLLIVALPLPALATDKILEVNIASQAQLEQLEGVGPGLAERILAARAKAPFTDWRDLRRRVSGMGPKLARKLSGQGLRVEGLPFPDPASDP